MSKIIQKTLLSNNWRFAKKIIGEDIYGKFTNMQISAFNFEKALLRRGIKLHLFDYYSDKKSTFFKIEIKNESIDLFYSDSRCIWSIAKEDMPTHRNDRWNEKRKSPEVSKIYIDAANGNLILEIKFNPNSKRYFYPSPEEISLNESLVNGKSLKYYEHYLK